MYDLITLQGVFGFIKDIFPWLIVLGGSIKWYFQRKDGKESSSLSKLETLSRIEERLRAGLQRQLEVTESKLELANKEVERLKLLIIKYELEVTNLRREIEKFRTENS